jgi:hypothetical protein
MMNATSLSEIRELDHRSSDGLEITLLWSVPTNQVFVAVSDGRQNTSIEIEIAAANARDAFLHPFAYVTAPDDDAFAA